MKKKIQKVYEQYEQLKSVIQQLWEDLEETTSDMDDIEGSDLIDSVSFTLPKYVHENFNNFKTMTDKLLVSLRKSFEEEEELYDMEEYLSSIEEALKKFDEMRKSSIDDSSEVYDLINDLQLPFDDLDTIWKDVEKESKKK